MTRREFTPLAPIGTATDTAASNEETIIRRFSLYAVCSCAAILSLSLFATAGLLSLFDSSFGSMNGASVARDTISSEHLTVQAAGGIGLAAPVMAVATVSLGSAPSAGPSSSAKKSLGASAAPVITPNRNPQGAAVGDSINAPPLRTMENEQIALMVKRGADLITAGDLVSARLLFQRAAEAGDAQAAFNLAATYDPNVLDSFRFRGMANTGKARLWYDKARSLGSAEAARRLEQLAGRAN